jgi:hypothetical protein
MVQLSEGQEPKMQIQAVGALRVSLTAREEWGLLHMSSTVGCPDQFPFFLVVEPTLSAQADKLFYGQWWWCRGPPPIL